ncbi:MAG: FMN-binding protein [Firmicutes bacterium]|jgi:major membrane immunogen (membrane-anchored lipoprotein)|nr:FMN-binding protein [Bacillota bacterium]NLO66800.1 FMN-binding protein [Bacillota bacterium]
MNRTIGVVIVLLVILGLAIYINAQRKDETSTAWQDGTYFGRSEPDQRGWFGEIEVTIKDGKITEASYEEMNAEGDIKDADYPYPAGPESHDDYEKALVETQDPNQVEAISGATQTRDRFVEAAEAALMRAERGDQSRPEPIVPPMGAQSPSDLRGNVDWEDGTYSARTEPDDHGYYGEIEIVIEDGRITEVTYDEKDQAGNPKGEDYPYPLGPESEDKFEEQLLETQDPDQVEMISGATQTWERFKATAKEALEKATQNQGDERGNLEQQAQ